MSIRVMSTVWDHFPGGGSQLLTMLALADWSNDDGGNIYPSVASVANKIRMSPNQARRILHALVDEGWLIVEGNVLGGGRGKTKRYRINIAQLSQATPTRQEPRISHAT